MFFYFILANILLLLAPARLALKDTVMGVAFESRNEIFKCFCRETKLFRPLLGELQTFARQAKPFSVELEFIFVNI